MEELDYRPTRNKGFINQNIYILRKKTLIFLDNNLNPLKIFKYFLIILFSIAITILFSILSIYVSYKKRVIIDSSNIPIELRTAVIYFNYEDILSNSNNINQITTTALNLYQQQEIDDIFIFTSSVNQTSFPSKLDFAVLFKAIPSDKITIYTDVIHPENICNYIKTKTKINEFLFLSYPLYLISVPYQCNSLGVYVKSYSNTREINLNLSDYFQLIKLINLV